MAKVICTLPNASEEICGVKFVSHRDGMISESVDADVAERFLSIPGYKLAGDNDNRPSAPVKPEGSAPENAEEVVGGDGAAQEAEQQPAEAAAEQPAAAPAGGKKRNK